MTAFVKTSLALDQIFDAMVDGKHRTKTVASIEKFLTIIEKGRAIGTSETTASKLAKELSLKPGADSEEKLYETLRIIPKIIVDQVPFLLDAEGLPPQRSLIFFLARELDYALDKAVEKAELVLMQLRS